MDGLAVLALEQTAGRGRLGRTWQSPPGNLNLSVLLHLPGGLAQSGAIALLMAVQLHAAVSHILGGGAGLMLKWPNDLLLNDGKVAGILIESRVVPSPLLVVGVGVNLLSAPLLSERRTAALARLGRWTSEPVPFAVRLLGGLEAALLALARDGFAPVRQAWVAAAHPVGSMLHVCLPDGDTVEGRFAGLAADGALLLEQGACIETIRAGDVLLA